MVRGRVVYEYSAPWYEHWRQFFIGLLIAGVLLLLLPLLVLVIVIIGPFFLLAEEWRKLRRRARGSPWHAFRAWLGWGRSPRTLARWLGLPLEELLACAPNYHEVKIPKRSGGSRTLHVPDDATRRLQRRILRRLLGRLRAHPAAVGFERGKSIVDNALPHAGRRVVIKLDLVDFFPRTTAERVEGYFRRIGWNRAAAEMLTRLTTWNGGLPQGAPTSPRLSNLVNHGLDVRLAALAARRKGNYTRYADDLTFSFPKDYPRRMRGLVQGARRILRAYGYELQGRKTRILRRHQRQVVTGLVVNDRVGLPRHLRRKLRAARHRLRTGREATWTPAQLQGWGALEAMVRAQASRQETSPPPSRGWKRRRS